MKDDGDLEESRYVILEEPLKYYDQETGAYGWLYRTDKRIENGKDKMVALVCHTLLNE